MGIFLDLDTGICSGVLRNPVGAIKIEAEVEGSAVLEVDMGNPPLGDTRFCTEVTAKTTPPVVVVIK